MTRSQLSLAGCRALVTGAGRGIGRAITRELAGRGALVIGVARTRAELDETIAGLGETAMALDHDITAPAAPDAIIGEVRARLGGLDILVHSAGIYASGPLGETGVEQLDRLYEANVRAPLALTQAALPALIAAGGQMVFVGSSIVHAFNVATRGPYAAMQAAFKVLADATRDEVNEQGVRVLTVFPGSTATPRQAAICAENGRPYRPERLLQPEDVARIVGAALELPRTAEVTEIAVRPMLKG